MRVLALLAVVAAVGATGCIDLVPQPVRHDIKDIQWKADAKKWVGTYTFSECAPSGIAPEESPPPCWEYVVVVDDEAEARVTVDGSNPPPRMKGTARVHRKGRLDIVFGAYADENGDVSDLGLHVLDPLRGRITPGSTLASIARDASGRPCLTFESMPSKLGTKTLCAQP